MALSFDDVLNGMEISAMNSSVPVSAIESITKGSGGMTVKYNMNGVFRSDLFDELLIKQVGTEEDVYKRQHEYRAL